MVPAESVTAQDRIVVRPDGRSTVDITSQVAKVVQGSGVHTGLCHVFALHTSCSLMICENADPDVRSDLEAFFARLVPDGDSIFRHRTEGPDDMAAHVRSVLTHTDIQIPVSNARLVLGTWQGLFLWEHRYRAYDRQLVVTVMGNAD